jgi:hypothetical protein
MPLFGKSHKYESQADLKDMTAEQIVNIEPKDVRNDLDTKTNGVTLDKVKKRAIDTLLSIKKYHKATPNETARQKAITNFLKREGIIPDPEVDRLIANTQTEMVQENMAKMREQLELKDMTNRLRALDNKPPIPDTEEESMVRRVQNLGGKRKRRRTVSKGKRREKTRKGRKGRKTIRRRK